MPSKPHHSIVGTDLSNLLWYRAFPLGSNWTEAALSPLKNTLKTNMDISNAQFGVISSASAFVNTIFPILGGMVLDWWGPNAVVVWCTGVIFLGSLIAAISTVSLHWKSRGDRNIDLKRSSD